LEITFLPISARACLGPLAQQAALLSGHVAFMTVHDVPDQASAHSLSIIHPRHNSGVQPAGLPFLYLDFIARLGPVTRLDFPLKMVLHVNSGQTTMEMLYSDCRAVPTSDVLSSSVDMTDTLDCNIRISTDLWFHLNFVRMNWDVGSGDLQLCNFGLTRRQMLRLSRSRSSKPYTDSKTLLACSALRSGQRVGDDVTFRAEFTESMSTPEYIPPLRQRCADLIRKLAAALRHL
jgi:hypothetical protein